jgi:dienelactone hydrolase
MRRFKIWQIALALIAILLLLGVVIFVIWAGVPLPADEQAFTALEIDASISVDTEPWLVFKPQSTEPTAGFIFYPGGRVQPEAYAPAARKLAEMGYLVVIPRMPLNLAFFDAEVANQIMEFYPEVGCWVVGGHSLGGAMAARFAYRHPESVDGLALWAAYPAESDDLSSSDLVVVSVYASEDGVAEVDSVLASEPLLPPDTRWVLIEGGNHAGFGWYGPQSGDNPRTISLESQQEQVISATAELLEATCE